MRPRSHGEITLRGEIWWVNLDPITGSEVAAPDSGGGSTLQFAAPGSLDSGAGSLRQAATLQMCYAADAGAERATHIGVW